MFLAIAVPLQFPSLQMWKVVNAVKIKTSGDEELLKLEDTFIIANFLKLKWIIIVSMLFMEGWSLSYLPKWDFLASPNCDLEQGRMHGREKPPPYLPGAVALRVKQRLWDILQSHLGERIFLN